MYQNLQVNPIINDIMCVPYEELRDLNTNTNNRCLETFPQGIPNNATITVYSPSNNGIIVLGYYVLDALNMSHSAHFDYLTEILLLYDLKVLTQDLMLKIQLVFILMNGCLMNH